MASTPAVVRELDYNDPAECAGFVDVLDALACDPAGGGTPLAHDVRERVVAGLRGHPTTLVLIALVEGRLVGAAVCFFGFSSFQARPLLNIHDLVVVPAHRGRGIGRALLAAVEARAVDAGCCKLTLEVLDTNVRARTMYTRAGFDDVVVGGSATRFLNKTLGG